MLGCLGRALFQRTRNKSRALTWNEKAHPSESPGLSRTVEVRINHAYEGDEIGGPMYSVSWPPTGYAMLKEHDLSEFNRGLASLSAARPRRSRCSEGP